MKQTILIIDDSKASLELMVYALQKEGYETIVACSVETGMDLMWRQPPDLVICDIHFPRMSGVQFAQAMKADTTLNKIPLLGISVDFSGKEAAAAGFDGYISKLIQPSEFAKRVVAFFKTRKT